MSKTELQQVISYSMDRIHLVPHYLEWTAIARNLLAMPGVQLRLAGLGSQRGPRLNPQCCKLGAAWSRDHFYSAAVAWRVILTLTGMRGSLGQCSPPFYGSPFSNGIYMFGLSSRVPKVECKTREGREGKKFGCQREKNDLYG